MVKEKLAKHLIGIGQSDILKNVRKYEGSDIGVDNLHITPEEALGAGINKYHLPKGLAQRLGSPAVESMATQGYALETGQSQGLEAAPPTNETQRIVITEESLRER